MTSPGRPVLVGLGVLGAAALVVLGLFVGSSLARPAAAAGFPDEAAVDAGFARDMQVHHAQAVEMSVLVRDRSDDPALRQLAVDILLTQQQQQGQMFGWLATWGLPQSSSLPVMSWMDGAVAGMSDGSMDGMSMDGDDVPAGQNPMVAMGLATDEQMAALAAADGQEAERLYLQLMIPHHLGGIDMAEVAEQEASQPQVRALAASMASSQSAEITVLQDMLDERGGPVDL